jgi:hypothetical protein
MTRMRSLLVPLAATLVFAAAGCGGLDEGEPAYASIKNDFNNPEMPKKPQWTICRSSYLGVDFGRIDLDVTSPELEVPAGLDNVLMAAAWEDPACAVENMLPIASKNEEEILPGQHRTLYINMPNHQGPCPPEGVQPIPRTLYDRMLALWPDLGFLPYDQRTQNPECL